MKRKLDNTTQKSFELAELSIENKSIPGFEQWLKSNDPEQKNSDGKTIVDVLIEDYIFKAKERIGLYSLFAMLTLLKDTESYKRLPPKTLFILNIICPAIIYKLSIMRDEHRLQMGYAIQNTPTPTVEFARDVYNEKTREFTISSLPRYNLPTLTTEQWEKLLYGEKDFVISYSDDWHVRDKRSIKIGSILITYQYGGKGSLETIIERIDSNKKSTQIIFESEKMRRENTALPFEAYIPFALEDEGNMTHVGGYQPTNYTETIKLLHKTWEIKGKIAEMAKPENNTEAKWAELISSLTALSTVIVEEKTQNKTEETDSHTISKEQGTVHIGSRIIDGWKRETFAQRTYLPMTKEIEALSSVLLQFEGKIDALKKKNENPEVVAIAEQLKKELISKSECYVTALACKSMSKNEAKAEFKISCATSIDKAKALLEKEQGWGDYLTNLLKSLVNAIISATNTITGSSFTLFTLAKPPMHAEIEVIEEVIADESMSLAH